MYKDTNHNHKSSQPINRLPAIKTKDRLSLRVVVSPINLQNESIRFRRSQNKAQSSVGKCQEKQGSLARLFDTEGLFMIGDFAHSLITAQFLGIAANTIALGLTYAGKSCEIFSKKENRLAIGFASMGVVSAITCGSILINSFNLHGAQFLNFFASASRELIFAAAAYASWIAANFLACCRKESSGIGNKQIWFCLGSLCATQANPFVASLLVLATLQALRGSKPDSKVNSKKEFFLKHLTPSRYRFLAFTASALVALISSTAYVVPFAIWALGNLRFDSAEMNRSFVADFKKIFLNKSKNL